MSDIRVTLAIGQPNLVDAAARSDAPIDEQGGQVVKAATLPNTDGMDSSQMSGIIGRKG